MRLRIASYNIHAGIGSDGQFDPARIATVIDELNADVIALQEVEHHLIEEGDFLDYLAARTGYQAVSGPTLMRETRHYGNAVLTRLPVIASQRRDISFAGHEPRAVLEVELAVASKIITVMATHLGLWPSERRSQVRQIVNLLQQSHSDYIWLMGDLNEWLIWGRPLNWLKHFFRYSHHIATFPSFFPLLSLDRLWVMPQQSLLSVRAHRSKISRQASDHLPLVGEVIIET
ncbi:Endonuclease/exonuclease/phosphatase [Methylophaga frappieri]|uniref:Endonuclease/exonuclease/phosphatase n=1 Tax=Methylophaga frappieri (strain ATCC BAA-2434 / DSM 25690 / JAM7) TaxID=754477 RepID=I1YJW9_METFJ|nr:endonuclease/exonuclease/phosphatase family protein [Methylophaga frappieri]AFJ03212.1 Endonuclease/exonuclease/phosphatase [Methylophaga frappieri]